MLSSAQFRLRPKHLWKSFCFGLGMLYLVSFMVLGYLKFIGEVMPFCFYDNFFYATFYFALFLYSVMAMELADVPVSWGIQSDPLPLFALQPTNNFNFNQLTASQSSGAQLVQPQVLGMLSFVC